MRLLFAAFVLLAVAAIGGPVNPNATLETRALFDNLMQIQQEDRLIFGQYYGTYQGRAANHVGDIYDMTGEKPGMNEWHVPYLYRWSYEEKMARLHEDYEAGMLIGFFWRMYNPITGGEASDTSDGAGGTIDIDTLLPGGIYHHKYLAQLDMFVEICDDLPKINGNPIPVFLRFLPEMSMGNARWYKSAFCTPEQYKQLWEVAYDYLVVSNGLNNILWQFNPNNTYDATSNRYGYKEYYPGHDLVDICGRNTPDDEYLMGSTAMDSMRHAITVAAEAGKLVAISQQNSYHNNADLDLDGIVDPDEFAPVSNWWTEVWLNRLAEDGLLSKIAFSCAWKNGDTGEGYFIPYKGHEHESNFVAMCAMPEVLLAPGLPDLYSPPLLDETVFEFTADEGFVNGELTGQQGWSGDAGAFSVDTNAPGILAVDVPWKSALYSPGVDGENGAVLKIGATLRFIETAVSADNKLIFYLLFNGTDDSSVSVRLKRQVADSYILSIIDSSGDASSQKGGSFSAAEIGTTNGPGSVADWLYLELALSKGSSLSNWMAEASIFNLGTDPDRLSPVSTVTHSFASSASFFDDALIPGVKSANLGVAGITNMVLDSVCLNALFGLFEQWSVTYMAGGPDENPDGDGLDNLAEYALGGDPTNAVDEGILPAFGNFVGGGSASYVYRRRTDDDSLTYWVEWSTNLVSNVWKTNGVIGAGSGRIDSRFESVTNTVSIEGISEQFIRLRIKGE